LQLLYPIGLLALAGLIIPVIIHLWSVKQGKTLKIGSIALLGESASATSKSFKLTDWLLFILRCLLLILIAFILTQPFFSKKIKTTANSGWILVQPNQFSKVYQDHRKSIDSLLTLGFELHEFNLGFKSFKLADTVSQPNKVSSLTYSSLFKKLDAQIPSGYTAYLFAAKKVINFSGDLPKISYKLVWKDMVNKDTATTWTTQFLGKTYEAKSTPKLTTYSSAAAANLPAVSVAIYEPAGNDSKYVRAALNAIADFTKRKIAVQNFNTATVAQADIIFWLSEQEPNFEKLKASVRIFAYEKGKVANVNTTLSLTDGTGISNEIKLFKHIQTDNENGKIVWKDGYGELVLVNEKKNYFSFYSRFNPAWTDLVWNEQFVNALMPIVLGEQNSSDFGFETHSSDQRVIAADQNLNIAANKLGSVIEARENEPLDPFLWILALITLLIERILSFRKAKLNHVKS